jgi:hypothetical protein
MIFYYGTPKYSVALNAKVGSSSMARAIIQQFYPRQDWLIRTAAYPEGKSPETELWHWMCSGSPTPTKPVVLLVRDPVDRFVSACQQINIKPGNIQNAIDSIIADVQCLRPKPSNLPAAQWQKQLDYRTRQNTRTANQMIARGKKPPRFGFLRDNVHFLHQHEYAVGPTTCFKFPRDMKAAWEFLEIAAPIPEANKAKRKKAVLTEEQETAVRLYYSADQQLFDNITEPGYVFTPDTTPAPVLATTANL